MKSDGSAFSQTGGNKTATRMETTQGDVLVTHVMETVTIHSAQNLGQTETMTMTTATTVTMRTEM